MTPLPRATRRYDVIVVGAGTGGGIVAEALAPLAAAGGRILVLERGSRGAPPGAAAPDEARHAADGEAHAAWLVADEGAVLVPVPRGYGGAMRTYGGALAVPAAELVDGWELPSLDGRDLEARARRQLERLGARFLAPEAINENNVLFLEGAARAGWSPEQHLVAVDRCRGAARCRFGCPNDAIRAPHAIHLPAAEAAGVEVVTGAEVRRLRDGTVEVCVHEADGSWPVGNHVVAADQVVLAGGALGSTAVLLRSGLDRRLRAIGRGVTLQPSLLVLAEHVRSIDASVGHPTSYHVDRSGSDGWRLEPCTATPFEAARAMAGFGERHAAMLRAFPRLQLQRVTVRDEPHPANCVTLDDAGRPVVRYALTPAVRERLAAGCRAAARLAFSAGAIRVHAPAGVPADLERRDIDRLADCIAPRHVRSGHVPLAARHPAGGCRMGHDTRDSVTDADGRVHGIPWLRIADASLLPSALGIPDALTVMALADRVAEALLADIGFRRVPAAATA
jgi:choline dehydrogenase-like flavoprotein